MPPAKETSRLHFGVAEWIGLAALALAPSGGFATWGLSMSTRIAVMEKTQEHFGQLVTKTDLRLDGLDVLVRIEEQLKTVERRLDQLEKKP